MRKTIKANLHLLPFYLCALPGFLLLKGCPFWVSFFFLFILCIAFFLELRREYPFPLKTFAFLGIVLAAFVLIFIPKLEGLSLLTAYLLLVKFLSPKKRVDYYEILLLSFLLLFAGEFSTRAFFPGLLFFPYFYFLTFSLFLLSIPSFPHANVDYVVALKRHLLLFGLFTLFFALLFVILPRPRLRLFPFSLSEDKVHTFGEVLEIGRSGNNYNSRIPFFRAEVSGTFPRDSLYWRGPVFSCYRRGIWTSLPYVKERGAEIRWGEGSARVRGHIYPEHYASSYIYVLDVPLAVSLKGGTLKAGGERWAIFSGHPGENFSYSFESTSKPADEGDLSIYLQLEPRLRETLRPLAREIVGDMSDVKGIASRIKSYLAGNYTYEVGGSSGGEDEVLNFLFVSKKGYCEHFATAFVLLLRSLGIPARAVGGFRGGDYNPHGGFYTVRERDAHLWAEVYVPGEGWVRYDPTPTRRVPPKSGFIYSLISYMEFLSFQWNKYVLSYSIEDQMHLLIGALVRARYILLLFFLIVVVLRLSVRCRRREKTGKGKLGEVSRMYFEILRIFAAKGFKKLPGETPMQFSLRVGESTFIHFTETYYRLRYSPRSEKEVLENYRSLYCKLRETS